VQERGGDGFGVELEVGQDGGHLQRMVDVVLTREAVLPGVGHSGLLVRLSDQLLALGVEVISDSEEFGNRQFVLGKKFRGPI
jgi:hypothetical protein